MSLSGIDDVDLLILAELPDVALGKACLIDARTRRLCQRETLWKLKLEKSFGLEYIEYKPVSLNWEQWYKWLYSHQDDLISETLELSIEQTYIRQVSETNVMEGSEEYQSMYILMPRIIYSGNRQLLAMAEEKINQLYKIRGLTDQFHDLLDFPVCFDSALTIGNQNILNKLLKWLEIIPRRFDYNLTRVLGKHGADDLFTRISLLYRDEQKQSLLIAYINGIIDSGNYDLAYQLIKANRLSGKLNERQIRASIIVSENTNLMYAANLVGMNSNSKAEILLNEGIFDLTKYLDVNLIQLEYYFIYLVMTDQHQLAMQLAQKEGKIMPIIRLKPFNFTPDLCKFTPYLPYLPKGWEESINGGILLDDCDITLNIYTAGVLLANTINAGYYKSFIKVFRSLTRDLDISTKDELLQKIFDFIVISKNARLDVVKFLDTLSSKGLHIAGNIPLNFEVYLMFQ